MELLGNIDNTIEALRTRAGPLRSLSNLAAATGAILLLFYALKLVYTIYRDLRLYFFNQYWSSGTDFRRRYGQWAVVTGATDGIGLAMAKELARRGLSIVVIGRNEEKLARTKKLLQEQPKAGEIVTVKIDLSNVWIDDYERVRKEIDPDNRDIGILINNAGLVLKDFAKFHQFSIEELIGMANVNSLAAVYFTKMILPGMVKRGHRRSLLLNVVSAIGSVPSPYMGLYYSTKAFMAAFSENLRLEYGSCPIDIVSLNPGVVHTKLFDNVSNLSWEFPFAPSPKTFAGSTLNALSTPYNSLCGTFIHELSMRTVRLLNWLGLGKFYMDIYLRFIVKKEAVKLLKMDAGSRNKKID